MVNSSESGPLAPPRSAIRPFAFAAPDPSKFYFALIADTHIIDSFYKGPEGNPRGHRVDFQDL